MFRFSAVHPIFGGLAYIYAALKYKKILTFIKLLGLFLYYHLHELGGHEK